MRVWLREVDPQLTDAPLGHFFSVWFVLDSVHFAVSPGAHLSFCNISSVGSATRYIFQLKHFSFPGYKFDLSFFFFFLFFLPSTSVLKMVSFFFFFLTN